MRPKRIVRCSFCGKTEHDVKVMVHGVGDVAICDLCVIVCVKVITEHVESKATAAVADEAPEVPA